MNVTLAQAEKILLGDHMFSQLGFSLLVTRLKGVYARDPTQTVMQSCMNEMNGFLAKYSSIMSADCSIILNL